MKKLILTLMIGMFLISFTSATVDLGTIKQRDCIQLYQSCPTCTYSDVRAIRYPNGTTDASMDWTMVKNNSDYTYQYCSTSDLGVYTYTIYGNKGGLSYESTESGVFEVTPSGFANTLGFHFLILILSLGIIIFGIGIADAPITILGSFGLYFLGLWILFNGIAGIRDATYTWAIGLILLGVAFYVSAKSTYELLS